MKKPNSLMKLPIDILDTLHTEELLLIVGGAGDINASNNNGGTCDGTNNSSGRCTGDNNGSGRCVGNNNAGGYCEGKGGSITKPPIELPPAV